MIVSALKQRRQRRNHTLMRGRTRQSRRRPLLSERLEPRHLLATFTVDSISDGSDASIDGICDDGAGACTLRAAVDEANANLGSDTIEFNIPGAGPHTIQPLSGLPTITDPVVIDGYTQPGASPNTNPFELGINAELMIEIDGNLIVAAPGSEPNGLSISAGNTTVRGLVINNFTGGNRCETSNGILLSGAGGNVIEGNFIGTDVDGTSALGNGRGGVCIADSPNNLIGGNTPQTRNLISGNDFHGVFITGILANGNQVQGNYVGTDVTGTLTVPNGHGVTVQAIGNVIGGTSVGTGNLISGNESDGVNIGGAVGDNGSDNLVEGNIIGTDRSGSIALGNGRHGINIQNVANNVIGGSSTAARNIISANGNVGVFISHTESATGNLVQGNFIGVDHTGAAPLGNALQGVRVDGAGNTIDGNVVSANGQEGVSIQHFSGNLVRGNLIGTDVSGSFALGNATHGVALSGQANGNTIGGVTISARNVISGNGLSGIISGIGGALDGNVIHGNYIGTDVSGTITIGNSASGIHLQSHRNVIGGQESGAGNLISGNGLDGIEIDAVANNVVQGNQVGTDATGILAIENGRDGVRVKGDDNTIGGAAAVEGNLISGNSASGVLIVNGERNAVQGNLIGTDIAGTSALANGSDGVQLKDAAENVIGGSTPESRNIISGNGSAAVYISGTAAIANQVQGNYIGTDVTGTVALGNRTGVTLDGAGVNNSVGGDAPGEGNLISANDLNGVTVTRTDASIVQGNIIGTDVTGTFALGNDQHGIDIGQSDSSQIGGDSVQARNLVSGNGSYGVVLSSASNSLLQGNYVGVDTSGNVALGNTWGVGLRGSVNDTIGGTAPGAGNLISGNTLDGIEIRTSGAENSDNIVQGNLIGTNVSGTVAVGNGRFGITLGSGVHDNLIGGTTPAARNVISGNASNGVVVDGNANVIQGNFIGTDISGTSSVPNLGQGINVSGNATGNLVGGTAVGAGNVISGNGSTGIRIGSSGPASLPTANLVQGNLIGTDITGTTAVGNLGNGVSIDNAEHNTIGGTTPGARNVISGHMASGAGGVRITGSSALNNTVQGNYIGTDISGTVAIGNVTGVELNSDGGSNTIGGAGEGEGNLISANTGDGVILISSNDNAIQGNLIGTDVHGSSALGNRYGVNILDSSTNNLIGGTSPGAGNVISANAEDGVYLSGGGNTGNVLQGNLIGTDVTGSGALANTFRGVRVGGDGNHLIGGTTPDAGNVISGNGEYPLNR